MPPSTTDLINMDEPDPLLEFDPLGPRGAPPPGVRHVTSSASAAEITTMDMGGGTMDGGVGTIAGLDYASRPLSTAQSTTPPVASSSHLAYAPPLASLQAVLGTPGGNGNGYANGSTGGSVSPFVTDLIGTTLSPTATGFVPRNTSHSASDSESASPLLLTPSSSVGDTWVQAGLPTFDPLALSDEESVWRGWPYESEITEGSQGRKAGAKDTDLSPDEDWLTAAWREAASAGSEPAEPDKVDEDGDVRILPPETFTWSRAPDTIVSSLEQRIQRTPHSNPGRVHQTTIAHVHLPRTPHPLPPKPWFTPSFSTKLAPPVSRSALPLEWRVSNPPVYAPEKTTDTDGEDSDVEPTEPIDLDQYLLPGGMAALTTDTLMSGSAYYTYNQGRVARTVSYNGYSRERDTQLQRDIMHSWAADELSASQKAAIDDLLLSIGRMVNKACPAAENPTGDRFHVDVFGSAAWGGGTGGRSMDIDLVIIDRNNPQGYTPLFWAVQPGQQEPSPYITLPNGRRVRRHRIQPLNVPSIYNMDKLASVLRKGGMRNCRVISFATTPIVKFYSPSGLQCDIGVNDLGGWYNSSLILAYCNICPDVLRPLIHTLKKWAQSHNVNNPAGEGDTPTMSSYCLTLMAIAYLQHKGMLPNLQAHVRVPHKHDPEDVNDSQDVIWVGWGRRQGMKARIGFDKEPPYGWRPSLHMTAAEAVTGFFSFFARDPPKQASQSNGHSHRDKFVYTEQFVSILNGGICRRNRPMGHDTRQRQEYWHSIRDVKPEDEVKQLLADYDRDYEARNDAAYMGTGNGDIQPRHWIDKRLIVQDPFIWDKNCAGNMSNKGLERFLAAVDATNSLLKAYPNATLAMVLGA